MKDIAEVLAESREYLETHGWWRGALRGPNGKQVCGMGAVIYSQGWEIAVELGGVTVAPEHRMELNRVLGKVLQATGSGSGAAEFVTWNDNEAKDKQEVLDAFAKAEKIERAGFDPDAS